MEEKGKSEDIVELLGNLRGMGGDGWTCYLAGQAADEIAQLRGTIEFAAAVIDNLGTGIVPHVIPDSARREAATIQLESLARRLRSALKGVQP